MESTRASLADELALGLCGFFLSLSWLYALAEINLVLSCRSPFDHSGSPLSDGGKLVDCKTRCRTCIIPKCDLRITGCDFVDTVEIVQLIMIILGLSIK